MKTILSVIFCFITLYSSFAQEPSQQLIDDYRGEMRKFNYYMSNLNEGYINAYNDLSSTLKKGQFKIKKSKHNYPKLVPSWFNWAVKKTPGIGPTLGKGSIYLLELGWKERNEELEAKRKKILLKKQIDSKNWILYNLNEFKIKMNPFISQNIEVSEFERTLDAKFYQKENKESEQVLSFLKDINYSFYKADPIFMEDDFDEDNNKKIRALVKQELYEGFINHFTTHFGYNKNNDLIQKHNGGYLVAYIEFDDKFHVENSIAIPNIPSGRDIGSTLNGLLPILKRKPFDLKVLKVLYIKSSFLNDNGQKIRKVWSISLDENNKVRDQNLEKNNQTKEFLNTYGKINQEGYWAISKVLFDIEFGKFTKDVPKWFKTPSYIEKMFEF